MTHPHAPHAHDAKGPWQQAEEYARMAERAEPVLRPLTQALLDAAYVGSGSRVLDLACGPGFTTAAAAARGAHALGIDVTPQMISVAKRRFPEVPFLVADMMHPPAGPWDAIISRFAVHHALPGWAAAAFRVTAEGGLLAIAELPPAANAVAQDGKQHHGHWVDLLREVGFKDLRTRAILLDSPSGMPGTQYTSAYIVAGSK